MYPLRLQRNLHSKGLACLALLLGFALLLPPGAAAQPLASPVDAERPWLAHPDSLMRSGEIQQAVQLYREALAAHPEDAALHQRLALGLLALGEPAAALGRAREAMRLDGGSVESLMILAQCQARDGDAAAGLSTLQKGLQSHPEDRQLLETLASFHLDRGEWQKATGLLRELVRLEPNRPVYRLELGRILLESNELDEADQVFLGAEMAGAEKSLARGLRGRVRLLQGKVEEARTLFRESRELKKNPEALGGLGAIAFLEGRPRDAAALFREAVQMRPTDADLHYNLGNALARSDQAEEAVQAYLRSLELNPRNAQAHSNLGALLLGALEVPTARRHLEESIRLDSELVAPWLHLARIHRAQYRFDDALRHYENYLQRNQDEREAKRLESVLIDVKAQAAQSKAALARGERHILQFRNASREVAGRFADQLRNGGDFLLLSQNDNDLLAAGAFDPGFVAPADLNPTFAKALTALPVGGVSAPIEGPGGWYVLQRVE